MFNSRVKDNISKMTYCVSKYIATVKHKAWKNLGITLYCNTIHDRKCDFVDWDRYATPNYLWKDRIESVTIWTPVQD